MAVARFQMDDGRIARFEVPDGSTPEQAKQMMQAHFANTKKAAQPKQPPVEDINARNVARSVAQGATFGFSDEIGAGVRSLIPDNNDLSFSERYRANKGEIEGQQKRFERQHPVASTVGELAGGALTGGVGLAKSGAATAARQAPGLLKIAGQGAAIGAGTGAAYGAGKAQEGETLEGAAIGGTTGALVGGTLSPAMAILGRTAPSIIKRTKDLFRAPNPATEKIVGKVTDDIADALTDEEAAAMIGEIAKRGGMTPEYINGQLEKFGSKATLADVDKNFAELLHDSISRFSPAKGAVAKQYTERLFQEHGDVLTSLSKQFNNHTADDIYNALENSARQRTKLAKPLYEEAFSSGFNIDLSKNPVFKIKNVQDKMKLANQMALNDVDRVVTNKAGENVAKVNPVERLHYTKQMLWDEAESLRRSGATRQAAIVDGQRKAIDEALNTVEPYAKARKIWSSSKEADEAGVIGQDFMKMNAREFKRAIDGMNPHEIERVKMGMIDTMSTKIEKTADKTSVARRIIENEDTRKKMLTVFKGDKEIKELEKNAEKWDLFRQTNRTLTQRSATKEGIQAGKEIDDIAGFFKGSISDKVLAALKGDRLTSERANMIANILRKEGLTKPDIERLFSLNKKIFSPGRGTAGAQTAITSQVAPGISNVFSEKKTLNDYMRRQ